MAYTPDEITHLETLEEEMLKRIENRETSSEAAVAYGKIGRVCTRALAESAALTAKRTAKSEKVTKFQTARQTRIQARKGGTGGTAQPQQPQGPSQQTRQQA